VAVTDYRPIGPDDGEEYRRFTRYAFGAERGPLADPAPFETDLFDLRGLYDDGLVSGCKRYHFEARVRDDVATVGGLGALATPPEHRRQGYARDLCRAVCREYADEGVALVTLWPFSTSFYRGLGWATANDLHEYALPPSALPAHEPRGQFRRLSAEDWARLRPAERATAEGVTLAMRRSERWWRERTLADWPGDTAPFVYGYERDGSVAGYLAYTVDDADDDSERTLSVSALGHVDEAARRSLLEFLRRHGAQIDRVELRLSTDDRLLDRLSTPDAATCERVPGPMARLTSLAPLAALDWETRVTLAVADDLLPENDTTVRVSPDGLERDVEATPDASVDVGTLTQLYLGRYDPQTAERVAGLSVHEEAARDPLAAAFPERPVCLREFF